MLSYAPTPLLGSTTPRIFTAPLVQGPPGPCGCGCALTPETSLGFSAVDFAEEVLGISLIPWQRWLFIHALELRANKRFRYRTVLILIARQNGKTTWVEIKNLWKMFVLRVPLIIGTAQNLDISEESWDKAVEIAESIPELAVEIASVDKTNGKKALKLRYGTRWKIAAASRRGGRGLSGDDVNLDELREHQNWDSWGAVSKTTMAKPNAQVFGYSNAGDNKSIVLNDLQAKGRAAAKHPAADPSLGLFEWSAPGDVTCSCGRQDPDPDNPDVEPEPHDARCRLQDRAAWAMANPSYNYTIIEEALSSALSTDPTPIFRTECLCQRVPDLGGQWQVLPEALWTDLAVAPGPRPADVAFMIDVAPDRQTAVICAVGFLPDGRALLSVVDHRPGTDWIPGRAKILKARWNPLVFAVDGKSPAGTLQPALAAVGITAADDPERVGRGDLVVLGAADMATAWGWWVDAARQRQLAHLDEAPLTVALAGAKIRNLGDGSAWARRGGLDITPLVGVTGGYWALRTYADVVTADRTPSAFWI